MNLFDRAKAIGLQTIKQWLPGGRTEGSEYVCINPTRLDKSYGSFKVNLETGRWSDWSAQEAGNDVVSLFAYIHRSEMEDRARQQNYKNTEGGIQAEAAKEILSIYDTSYFPSAKDDFMPSTSTANSGKGFWDGWHQVTSGSDKAPTPDESIKWMIDNIIEIEREDARWLFHDKKGHPFFWVVRFISKGKKDDRPFTLWRKGSEYRWRCKGFKELCKTEFRIPLYNRHLFEEKQNLPILMVEGQKNSEHAAELLSDDFICTTEYGGLKNTELEILRGRTVYRWIDPDIAGAKKLKQFKELTKDLDITLHIVKSPVRKPAGWDISDAIKDGWTKDELIIHIEGYNESDDESYVEDGLDFKIIGVTNTDIWFFPRDSKLMISYKKHSLTKNALLSLMPREKWGIYFSKPDGGIAWDAAVDFILRKSADAPFYYNTMVRGAGAWKDEGRLVLNCGSHLYVEGEKIDLYDFDSKYIYERKDFIPYSPNEKFTAQDGSSLLDILKLIDFTHKADHLILAGWLLLAPFGGALNWRPKVWLSGPRGSGKTYIIDYIITPLIGQDYGHIAPGTSSEAAIRRQAGTNSLPNIHDEMEADNKSYAENINNILMFYRVGASGENGGIIKVDTSGNIQKWISQCMALFASIGAAIKNGADRSRITVINLRSPRAGNIRDREDKFKEIEEKVELLTKTWSIGFNSRTYQIWPEIERCIEVMVSICTEELGSRREGDQIGTLMAGAYMVNHDKAPVASEALEWIRKYDIESISSDKYYKLDEELVIDEILSYKLRINEKYHNYSLSIANLLIYWFINNGVGITSSEVFDDYTYDLKLIKIALEEHGINPVKKGGKSYIHIAKGHPKIKDILKSTPWPENYTDFLKRLPCAEEGEHGPSNFAGLNKRFVKLDALELLDQPPF